MLNLGVLIRGARINMHLILWFSSCSQCNCLQLSTALNCQLTEPDKIMELMSGPDVWVTDCNSLHITIHTLVEYSTIAVSCLPCSNLNALNSLCSHCTMGQVVAVSVRDTEVGWVYAVLTILLFYTLFQLFSSS